MTTDPSLFTVAQAVEALTNRQISSVELTQAFLRRIDALDTALHAYLSVDPERALQQATMADMLRSTLTPGDEQPPLLGLPIAVKDVLAVKGMRCTCGSKILQDYISPYTATSVQKLLEAGVVILGKTNTDEFAMGSSTESSAYGVTRNPWDLERVPGGSSGGSAAAVAGSLAPAAFGTDTGGSVRQPASYCGLTGIKPTYGRVSRYGLVAYGSSLDSVGMFAHTAEDVALITQHMAGVDPLDSTSADLPVPSFSLRDDPDLHGLRIGVPDEYFIAGMSPEVEAAVRAAIDHFSQLGAEIRRVSLPHTEYALPVYYLIAPAEASANLARYDGIRFGPRAESDSVAQMYFDTRGEGFGSEVKRRIMLGTYALSAGYYDAFYGQAQKVRTLIKRDFERAFETVDVLATPVAPSTAFKFGDHSNDPLAMYLEDVFTLPTNLAGVPGLAAPVGFDSNGMPIGMQLMGRPFDEVRLLQTVHAYQLTTEWHTRVPELVRSV